jgi:threonine aldolase
VPVRADGALDPGVITGAVKEDDFHYAIPRLLSLENTHNGLAVPLADMHAAAEAGRGAGLSVHLDGARFFNAVTALGCSDPELADVADTVSICLSKGLGAPVGSVLAGPKELVARARRWRKMLGGGMRQAGVLAAAGLFALEHNTARLAEDHSRAAALADALRGLGCGAVSQSTNMVFFTPADGRNADLRSHLAADGVVIGGGASGAIRLVLHKDVDDAAFEAALSSVKRFYG